MLVYYLALKYAATPLWGGCFLFNKKYLWPFMGLFVAIHVSFFLIDMNFRELSVNFHK